MASVRQNQVTSMQVGTGGAKSSIVPQSLPVLRARSCRSLCSRTGRSAASASWS
jgi:hypothetical protein